MHGFKTGGSGGGVPKEVNPLNFNVVAYPSEIELNTATGDVNTIGVITTNPINGWCFAVEQPENMAEGELWFGTGTPSSVPFNALKENTIMVYPRSAKQMVSGVLVDVTAKSWQNGEWVEWVTYIFDAGFVLPAAGTVVTAGNAKVANGVITGSQSPDQTSAFTFSKKINIDKATKLCVELIQTATMYDITFGLATSNALDATNFDNTNALMANNARKIVSGIFSQYKIVELDISAYSGQSMYVMGNGISDYSVRRIWLSN